MNTNSLVRQLARERAADRLSEIDRERQTILKIFPGIKPSAGTAISFTSTATTDDTQPTRRRRRMSAAARKAVSDRMKKYWASRRKNTK